MPREPEDWAGVAERVLAGDRVALLQVSRLIASLLARWRAYDFRDEWPDVTQDVLLAVLTALKQGSLRSPDALVGYVAAVARNRWMDRLRAARPRDGSELYWPGAAGVAERLSPPVEAIAEVRRLLDRLPEKQRALVFGVYGEGKTYEAMALEAGIPLGTAKRYLREGLAALRCKLRRQR